MAVVLVVAVLLLLLLALGGGGGIVGVAGVVTVGFAASSWVGACRVVVAAAARLAGVAAAGVAAVGVAARARRFSFLTLQASLQK